MRAIQISFGLIIIIVGVFLFWLTSGWLALTMLDLLGYALLISGLLFWIPGIALRRARPWLTVLFLPGALAFAVGAGLVYTQRVEAGFNAWSYLWTTLLIALGVAFLAMAWLGPRVRWLKFSGMVVSSVGILLFAIFVMIFATEPTIRLLSPLVLIAFGVLFTLGALLPRK